MVQVLMNPPSGRSRRAHLTLISHSAKVSLDNLSTSTCSNSWTQYPRALDSARIPCLQRVHAAWHSGLVLLSEVH